MQLDAYTVCPCGSGKKIKFCCSKDLLHDIDKILRALVGQQYISALDQTTKLIAVETPFQRPEAQTNKTSDKDYATRRGFSVAAI